MKESPLLSKFLFLQFAEYCNINDIVHLLQISKVHKRWIKEAQLFEQQFYNEYCSKNLKEGIKLATRYHLINVLEFVKDVNWDFALAGAAKGGHRDLMLLCEEKGANNWDAALRAAACGGHKNLMLLCEEKGANDWNTASCAACTGGYRNLMLLCREKGANGWMAHCIGQSKEDIKI